MDRVMTGDVGGRLRLARERRGMSLPDVAKRTKLPIAVLQAIEQNDFAGLPGGMFRKAYVRTLAVEFGLDPNVMAAEYCARFEPPSETPAVSPGAALEEQRLQQLMPSRRRSFLTLAVLAAPAAAWFMLQPRPVGSSVPPYLAATPATELPAARVRDDASPAPTAKPRRDVRPIETVALATSVPLRVELAASGWCWVAADADGERVMYRLVGPGERLRLEGQHAISLRLGNAAAVTLSINDGPKRSLGGDGEVAELEVTLDNVEGLRDAPLTAVSDTGA